MDRTGGDRKINICAHHRQIKSGTDVQGRMVQIYYILVITKRIVSFILHLSFKL